MWEYTINHRVIEVKVTLWSDVWPHLVEARWLSSKLKRACESRYMVLMLELFTWTPHTLTCKHISIQLLLPLCISADSQTASLWHKLNPLCIWTLGPLAFNELLIFTSRLLSRRRGGWRPWLSSLVWWLFGVLWGSWTEPVHVLFGWPGAFV